MNKHLKALLNTPGLERLQDFSLVGPVQKAAVEYFVDLLVLECVYIIAATKDESIDFARNVDEAMSLAEMDIMKHFGVNS